MDETAAAASRPQAVDRAVPVGPCVQTDRDAQFQPLDRVGDLDRDLRRAAARRFLPRPQHPEHRSGDRHPWGARHCADDRHHLRRARHFRGLDGRHVDRLHCDRRGLDRFDDAQHCGGRCGRHRRRLGERTDRHRRRRQRGDRHPRHDGGVSRRRLHHQRWPVDPDIRSRLSRHWRRTLPRRANHDLDSCWLSSPRSSS